jgi:hypothetical protein
MEEYKKRKAASQSVACASISSISRTIKNSEAYTLTVNDLIQIPVVVDQDEPSPFRPYVEDDIVTELKQQLDSEMIDLLVKTFL